jgi:hypothetical protein
VILLILPLSVLLTGCYTFQKGLYEVFIDQNNGDKILVNEPNVRSFLEKILQKPEDFAIAVYSRIASRLGWLKKSELLTHKFYVITQKAGDYHTLSFYGTKFAFYSEGAWVMDTDSDLNAYKSYLQGYNNWQIDLMKSGYGVNAAATVQKIIEKIDDKNITYYYKDHLKNKPNVDNCNTALDETLVEYVF